MCSVRRQVWTRLRTPPPSLVITSIRRIRSGGFGSLTSTTFDLAILVRHVDSPVYAMRLPD